jgi:hypothetical protein
VAYKRSGVEFHGESGKSYKFNVWPLNHDFPHVGAVYAITRRYKAEGTYKHDVIYIGRTENHSAQFNNQQLSDCIVKRNADCICTHTDPSEKSRAAKENDLTQKYNPDCNN